MIMALLERLFKSKKQSVEVDAERMSEVLNDETEPRPLRSIAYRECFVTYGAGYKRRGVVLDYNETGVRIRFPTNEQMPEDVVLNASAVKMTGPARVVWQRGSEAGIALLK